MWTMQKKQEAMAKMSEELMDYFKKKSEFQDIPVDVSIYALMDLLVKFVRVTGASPSMILQQLSVELNRP